MQPFDRARCSLAGLAVGDGFGEQFFKQWRLIERRAPPPPPWHYTDDTLMALSIVSILRQYGEINQQALAHSFAERYMEQPGRGYGPGMHRALRRVAAGEAWDTVARGLFNGQGSFGNGAAMRIAPLGAYFADDLDAAAQQARLAAEVTHAHPEAIAGAIAVAIAAALAWQMRHSVPPEPAAFLARVLPYVPQCHVRDAISQAQEVTDDTPIHRVAAILGNGSQISAQDTVGYVLWCAAQQLDDFTGALWLTVRGKGDMDTNCAMVGGIVALYTGGEGIPAEWRNACEPLPTWYLTEPDND